jgi:hypothetical protein
MALQHLSVHRKTGKWQGLVDDLQTEVLVAWRIMSVKFSAIEFTIRN